MSALREDDRNEMRLEARAWRCAVVIDGLKIAENQRFEIASPAAPARRSLGGEQLLDGMPRQGLQPPEAGAKGPPLRGLPSSQASPPGSAAGRPRARSEHHVDRQFQTAGFSWNTHRC
jgi:hypothetical protein